ncbi:SURF1 family protein [Noviherbaspirillum cavernae]|uniref:SURF1-like protein n=1 Tax=Noviherbaspirillum cavernae TaxID=2320862 RepID=A0A418WXM7_9BURK|nr:SURF1 family protein [Noviherbaspirillum cavernae]RJG04962.1 SURF1 family protein [Noviherbaspirillum cavernae]
MRIKFRFGWGPFVAAAMAIAVGVSLGQWQMRRAADKEAIERHLSAQEDAPPILLDDVTRTMGALEYRRVIVRGEFVRDWAVYLDNRPHNGAAGFYMLMPLKIAGSDSHVLVARGWVKRDLTDRKKLPPIVVPPGIVEIQGVVRRNAGRVLQLGTPEALHPNAIVQNLDIQALAQAANMPIQPFMIEQLNDTHDGLMRDWPRPSSGIDKHFGYAFQWYALAATAFVFFLVTGFRRGRQ